MKVSGAISDSQIVEMIEKMKAENNFSDTQLGQHLGGVTRGLISNVLTGKQKPGLKFSIFVMHRAGYECATEIMRALMPDGLEKNIKHGKLAAELAYARKRKDDDEIGKIQDLMAALGEIEVKERSEEIKKKRGRPKKNDDKETTKRKVAG